MVSLATDGWTRLRYRRAELRRLAPAGPSPDASGAAPHWAAPEETPQGPASILIAPVGARVTYQVMLPDNARIVARCAVGGPAPAEVVFTIEASAGATHVAGSCRVSAGGPARPLRLRVTSGGAATIVLIAELPGSASPAAAIRAQWHNPRVEWRRPVRDVAAALATAARRRSLTPFGQGGDAMTGERLYRLWVREQAPSTRVLRAQRARAASVATTATPRRFTLITLLGEPAPTQRSRTLDSLLAQSYPHWEWVVVTSGADRRLRADAEREPRILVIQASSGATRAGRLNQALAHARGEHVAVVDDLDSLAPTALFDVAQAAGEHTAIDVFYSDEDSITDRGGRFQPRFKPDWSPELLLAGNYIGRLAMIRVSAILAAGGYRDGFGDDGEWELLLRLSRAGAQFRRAIGCLYHRHESAVPGDTGSAAAVLRDHAQSLGLRVEVTGSDPGSRLRWSVEGCPKVSVIIPNRDAYGVLSTCVEGLLDGTSYPNRELIIVDNGSTDAAVLDLYARLERDGRGRIVPFDRPFNFSAACNAGAAAARGDLLLFLNNDIEVVEPEWMEELVRWARRPGVGVVGAKLLYPDRLIQHAGVVFGLGLVGHIFARAAEGTRGVFGSTDSYRNYMAVTGACQMMSREVFELVGGYDERLRLSFSDVVLCMEARKAGYRVVYTPFARLIHHESYTRRKADSAEDMERFAGYLRRTGFVEDPYLHPHLDPQSLIPAVRPPFDPLPRQVIADFIDRVLAAAAVQPAP